MLTVGSYSLLFMSIPLQLHHLICLLHFPLPHHPSPLQITLPPQQHWSVTETQIDILSSRHEQLQWAGFPADAIGPAKIERCRCPQALAQFDLCLTRQEREENPAYLQ